MNRFFVAVAAFAAVLGGGACGSGSSSSDLGSDLGATATLSCLGVGGCVLQCIIDGRGDFNTCPPMCQAAAKPGSYTRWVQAFLCGQSYCAPGGDMGGKCVLVVNPDPNQHDSLFCDPGQTYDQCKASTTRGPCVQCLDNARNVVYGDFSDPQHPKPPTGMCPDGPSFPDCEGGATCKTIIDACISDP